MTNNSSQEVCFQLVDVMLISLLSIPAASRREDHGRSSTSFIYHAKTQHAWILAKFFGFHVLISSLDFSTDIIQAAALFNEGHTNWGLSTLAFVFLPFVGRLLMLLYKLSKIAWKEKESEFPSKWFHVKWFAKRSLILWHLPPLIIIR